MDANGFRKGQAPDFFSHPTDYSVETRVKNLEAPSKNTAPTPDNRYAGFAAQMNDGRIITDYRPHCDQNIATGSQFASRQWLQHNANQIIRLSRDRQASAAGAGMGYDSTIEVPPIGYVMCDESDCGYVGANPRGIGIERRDRAAPLFGTFAQSRPVARKDSPQLTTLYEGGRNSVRGLY
jgi:hypothetical protein